MAFPIPTGPSSDSQHQTCKGGGPHGVNRERVLGQPFPQVSPRQSRFHSPGIPSAYPPRQRWCLRLAPDPTRIGSCVQIMLVAGRGCRLHVGADIRPPEAINRLLGIADEEEPMALTSAEDAVGRSSIAEDRCLETRRSRRPGISCGRHWPGPRPNFHTARRRVARSGRRKIAAWPVACAGAFRWAPIGGIKDDGPRHIQRPAG